MVEAWVCGCVVLVFSVFPDWVLELVSSDLGLCVLVWRGEGIDSLSYVSEIVEPEYGISGIGESIH